MLVTINQFVIIESVPDDQGIFECRTEELALSSGGQKSFILNYKFPIEFLDWYTYLRL